MRNQIITYILLAIFILGIISLCSFGVEVGKLKVSSIDGILQKNEELNEKIEIAKQLTSDEYSGTIRRLEQTYEKHQITKEKYEEMLDLTNEKKNNIYEIKQYDIGYLWKVIGTYAANHKLNVSMSVEKTT